MSEQEGSITEERLGLHKADCRAGGGRLTIPCSEGMLLIMGPHPRWRYTLAGVPISESRVLQLKQVGYSY